MERPTHRFPFILTMLSGFLLLKLTRATSRRNTGTRSAAAAEAALAAPEAEAAVEH